jgi:hypothetical protein
LDRTILLTSGEYTIREPRRSSTIGSLDEKSSFIAKEPARLRYSAAGEEIGVVIEVDGVSILSNTGFVVQIRFITKCYAATVSAESS